MWTTGPAARPPHSFFKLRAHPLYMLPPGLIFFDGDGPADPLIARQRRYVFPRGACPGVGRERLSKIIWEVMNDSSRHLNRCHRGISPVLAFAPILALAEQDSSLQGDCGRLGSSNFLPLGKTPGELLASETLNMQLPSIQVRNLIETAVLQIQHSPDLSEEEVRWIQQFAAHLITEFSVLKEPDLLYAPVEDDTSADQHGQPMNRVGTL